MIGRRLSRESEDDGIEPKGFDSYTLLLGDVMRGERATMGKSLLDVQRELRIKASQIAAIENADPEAFETPGFISGYVKSYARYLGMDPDRAFDAFCAESGFEPAHGMSTRASSIRKPDFIGAPIANSADRDQFVQPKTPFVPDSESFLSRVDGAALVPILIMFLLIGGIGFGGWKVLRELQQVQVVPVDQTPVVLSSLDPLDAATARVASDAPALSSGPQAGALDRLYRPQALTAPVLVARDAPISTLNPSDVGNFGSVELTQPDIADVEQADTVVGALTQGGGAALPQVLETLGEGVTVVATGHVWMRISSAVGTRLYEQEMFEGDSYTVPQLADAPSIDIGNAGEIYFIVDGEAIGPAGRFGKVDRKISLEATDLTARYEPVDLNSNEKLMKVVAELPGLRPTE